MLSPLLTVWAGIACSASGARFSLTVKVAPLLASPATVTTTGPVVVPVGTVTVTEVSSQLVAVAATPLKLTVLVPCVAPKLVPVISTDVPSGPVSGLSPVIAGFTVNGTPLLAWLCTVTTTLPVVAPAGTAAVIEVALQLVAVAELPLKLTVLVPCVAPKFPPAIVTDVPSGPLAGFNELMDGTLTTVKAMGLLTWPPTVTTTLPVVAVAGTAVVIALSLQFVGVASTPLKLTVLVPWEAPKFAPVISTVVPAGPESGFKPLMTGSVPTVKGTPLLASPPTVTTTLPVVAPAGTVTVIEVALQPVGVAAVPLKVTVLLPCIAPKLVPLISTVVPSGPATGLNEPIAGVTVKDAPPLGVPSTVTTTGPVVAPAGTVTEIEVSLQSLAVAPVPLKVTVLVACAAPKLVPVISTVVPSGPESGLRLPIAGATVKETPLLAVPSTVTTTSPVAAPIGTATVIEVSLQLVGVAATPLKVTVLVP